MQDMTQRGEPPGVATFADQVAISIPERIKLNPEVFEHLKSHVWESQ